MTYLIGIVGAPGSGKSVIAARLYAELLERGINSSRLVTEAAAEYLGRGNTIINLDGQIEITDEQIKKEEYNSKCNFNPIICDSAIWLGSIYREFYINNNPESKNDLSETEYIENNYETIHDYAMTVYVPLFHMGDKINNFRIHDGSQSREIDKLIENRLSVVPNLYSATKFLNDREHFIKYLAGIIIENMEK